MRTANVSNGGARTSWQHSETEDAEACPMLFSPTTKSFTTEHVEAEVEVEVAAEATTDARARVSRNRERGTEREATLPTLFKLGCGNVIIMNKTGEKMCDNSDSHWMHVQTIAVCF